MCKTRLLAAVLAAGVLAGACGGDDPGEAPPLDQPAVGVSDATPAADVADPGSVEGTPTATEASTVAAAADDASVPITPLGGRFQWCAATQGRWDDHADPAAAVAAALVSLEAATAAHTAAIDDLDRAAAAADIETAVEALDAARADAEAEALGSSIIPLLESATGRTYDWGTLDGDETKKIAYERAWGAFTAAATSDEVAFAEDPYFGILAHEWPFDEQAESVRVAEIDVVEPTSNEDLYTYTEAQLVDYAQRARDVMSTLMAHVERLTADADVLLADVEAAVVMARTARDRGDFAVAAGAAVEARTAWSGIEILSRVVDWVPTAAFRWVASVQRAGWAARDSGYTSFDPDAVADLEAARLQALSIQVQIRDEMTARASSASTTAARAAADAILVHSPAHAAFARSLGESCRP